MSISKTHSVRVRVPEDVYRYIIGQAEDGGVSAVVRDILRRAMTQDRADSDKWSRLVERIEAADVTAIGDDLSVRLSAVKEEISAITRMLKRHDYTLQEYARDRMTRADLFQKVMTRVDEREAKDE